MYSNIRHPTLERMMGVHKADRNKGPRFALKGQLAGMKVLHQKKKSASKYIDVAYWCGPTRIYVWMSVCMYVCKYR